jgi:hypothetical protein
MHSRQAGRNFRPNPPPALPTPGFAGTSPASGEENALPASGEELRAQPPPALRATSPASGEESGFPARGEGNGLPGRGEELQAQPPTGAPHPRLRRDLPGKRGGTSGPAPHRRFAPPPRQAGRNFSPTATASGEELQAQPPTGASRHLPGKRGGECTPGKRGGEGNF